MSDLSNMFRLIAERGLTAKKVADETGISTGNISDWKSGRSSPSVLKLAQIADFLDCSMDFLVGRTNRPVVISEMREEDQELLSAFHKLDEKDRYKALGYIDSLYSADKYSAKEEFKDA